MSHADHTEITRRVYEYAYGIDTRDWDLYRSIFADDLTSSKAFAGHTRNEDILDELQECQAALHAWGNANQVVLDPSKESFHVLHRRSPYRESFRLLGVT